jgi:osmotically-inducible protein OsmY
MRTLPLILVAALSTPVWAHGHPHARQARPTSFQKDFVDSAERVARGQISDTTVGDWHLIRDPGGVLVAERTAEPVAGGRHEMADRALRPAVRAALTSGLVARPNRIRAQVKNGSVILRGRVADAKQVACAMASLTGVRGVNRVLSRLTFP